MISKQAELESKRQELIRELKKLGPWIEGTLVATARLCGKTGCVCHRDGPKHPVLFVTWKESGKTVSLYVPKRLEAKVRVWADNYKRLKDLIRRISEVQKQIVRLRE